MIGRVYKIEVNENDFYIGSTIKYLSTRQAYHNRDYKKRNSKLYETCRKNNIEKIICILLEEREVEDIKEIRQLEQQYITKLQPSLNSWSAYATEEDRKEHIKEYNTEYYEKNKERIRQKDKEYYEKNKDKILERQKEKNKEYYYKNKDKLLERQGEKINCPICNSVLRRDSLIKHKKSLKCRSSIECFIEDE